MGYAAETTVLTEHGGMCRLADLRAARHPSDTRPLPLAGRGGAGGGDGVWCGAGFMSGVTQRISSGSGNGGQQLLRRIVRVDFSDTTTLCVSADHVFTVRGLPVAAMDLHIGDCVVCVQHRDDPLFIPYPRAPPTHGAATVINVTDAPATTNSGGCRFERVYDIVMTPNDATTIANICVVNGVCHQC